MKYLFRLPLLLTVFTLFLFACSRDDMDEIIVDDPVYTPDTVIVNNLMNNLKSNNSGGMDLGCVTILFPFDLLTQSGGSVTVSSEDEFFEALEMDSSDLVVDFDYPISVADLNGNNEQVNDANELGILFASCIPSSGWTQSGGSQSIMPAALYEDFCYDIVYPVELLDNAGNSQTADNESEFIDLLATVGPLYFVLPVSFEDDTGNVVEVDDFDSFFDLAYECEDIHAPAAGDSINFDGFPCFDLVFPYDVEYDDGTTETIENDDDYANLVLSGDFVNIVFPFSIQDSTGSVTVINTIDDLVLALIDCGIIEIITGYDTCSTEAHALLFYNSLNIFTLNNYPYDISYPVTLIIEGTPVVINNGDEYIPAVGGNPSRIIEADIVYPVTVTQFGREITLNSDEDVCEFYKSFLEPCENKPAHIQFFFNEGGGTPINCAYFIEYPVEINQNGAIRLIENRDEYITELNTPGAYDDIEVVYPVSVTKFIDGQQVTFESDDAICDYLDTCL